jgi:hypothetical protein
MGGSGFIFLGMSELCPHCNRVAQQVSENCLYCGKPLPKGGASRGDTAATGPEPAPAAPAGPGPAAARPSNGDEIPEAGPPPLPAETPVPPIVVRRSPVDEARARAGAAESGPGFFQSTVGRTVIFVAAAVMVLVAVATVLKEPSQSGPEPEAVEEAAAPAGGEVAVGAAPAPDDEAPVAASAGSERRAQEGLNLVARWIADYASEYGHYPKYVGDRLDALAQFAAPGQIDDVLGRFEGGRVEYVRRVAGGGNDEQFEVTALVRGPGRRTVSASGTRARGGSPRNPAPLP